MTVLLKPQDSMPAKAQKELERLHRELRQLDIAGGGLHDANMKLGEVWRAVGLAKLAAVKQYLTDVLSGASGDAKVLVFAHHIAVLDACCQLAAVQKVGWIRIDGE
eukprot:SAG11_NODE_1465_length_4859_cov_9.864916_4_plen_106_part_00